ncbi:hypothetical protein NIES2104_07250 [Leptolyngbya sp. NIES-2104]|nr:hypothetical protein NIES2104_07250 [Leptolyngbya sp. NIES-2104]
MTDIEIEIQTEALHQCQKEHYSLDQAAISAKFRNCKIFNSFAF